MDLSNFMDVIHSDEAYEILDRHVGGGWTTGGCLLLSKVLHNLLAGSKILAVCGQSKTPQHLVVLFNGSYIDGDGVCGEEKLLYRWEHEEGLIEKPFIADVDLNTLSEDFISSNEAEEQLRCFLKQKLS